MYFANNIVWHLLLEEGPLVTAFATSLQYKIVILIMYLSDYAISRS